MFPGKFYDEVAAGDTFSSRLTVTEAHIVTAAGLFGDFNPVHVDEQLAAGLFGDFNPVHVDEVFAAESVFQGRVLHGPFTGALMSAAVGMYFAGTAIAYLEHNCRFLAPVRPGDTLTSRWRVVETLDKPKHAGGIVVLKAVCQNQENTVVAEAEGKILVKRGD